MLRHQREQLPRGYCGDSGRDGEVIGRFLLHSQEREDAVDLCIYLRKLIETNGSILAESKERGLCRNVNLAAEARSPAADDVRTKIRIK